MARQDEVDDATLLRLLWNPERPVAVSRPGPKSHLTLTALVEAGIAIADDRGGPGLSMRSVAERLGCTPMALYSYVDSKETLLRLMYDAVHAEFAVPADRRSGERVLGCVEALADLYARHHWLADVSWSRPVLGPREQQVLESLLGALVPLRLSPRQNGPVASALLTLARSSGRLIADARHARVSSGKSDEQWWGEQSAVMAKLVPDFAERFPLSARVTTAPPLKDCPPEAGHLERSVRAQLAASVRMLLAGARA
ncbi:MAG: TetR/AcrR family transcriptional regulator [Cystobacter sp.]